MLYLFMNSEFILMVFVLPSCYPSAAKSVDFSDLHVELCVVVERAHHVGWNTFFWSPKLTLLDFPYENIRFLVNVQIYFLLISLSPPKPFRSAKTHPQSPSVYQNHLHSMPKIAKKTSQAPPPHLLKAVQVLSPDISKSAPGFIQWPCIFQPKYHMASGTG